MSQIGCECPPWADRLEPRPPLALARIRPYWANDSEIWLSLPLSTSFVFVACAAAVAQPVDSRVELQTDDKHLFFDYCFFDLARVTD